MLLRPTAGIRFPGKNHRSFASRSTCTLGQPAGGKTSTATRVQGCILPSLIDIGALKAYRARHKGAVAVESPGAPNLQAPCDLLSNLALTDALAKQKRFPY